MRIQSLVLAMAALVASGTAAAWGREGHEIVAAIARDSLTPAARRWIDGLLRQDADALTRRDMLSRAWWADVWRETGHRGSAPWHYVDLELDGPDLAAACRAGAASGAAVAGGTAPDCIVGRLTQFEAELSAPATPLPERLLALKFVLHLAADLHQPLHAADDHDRGGNCVRVEAGHRTLNLHAYWDSAVLAPLGRRPVAAARRLEAAITPAERAAWSRGTVAAWARESYRVARVSVYTLGSLPGCPAHPLPIVLPAAYEARAGAVARLQLEKAGVRLAVLLNRAAASATPATAPPGTTRCRRARSGTGAASHCLRGGRRRAAAR